MPSCGVLQVEEPVEINIPQSTELETPEMKNEDDEKDENKEEFEEEKMEEDSVEPKLEGASDESCHDGDDKTIEKAADPETMPEDGTKTEENQEELDGKELQPNTDGTTDDSKMAEINDPVVKTNAPEEAQTEEGDKSEPDLNSANKANTNAEVMAVDVSDEHNDVKMQTKKSVLAKKVKEFEEEEGVEYVEEDVEEFYVKFKNL
jgi:protein MAK16